MRLMALAVVVTLTTPGLARAQEDDDELAPLAPKTQPKRPKKKVTPPATTKPEVTAPETTKPAREDFAPLELNETPAVEPKKAAPPPAEPRTAAPQTPAPSQPGYEDPDLAAATQVKKSAFPLTTVGWVAAGVGAAAVVTGAIVGGLAASARSGLAVDARGVVVNGDPEQAAATVRLSRLSSGLIISGGLALAGGLVLALWPSPSPARSALRLIPTVDSSSASLLLQGVWP
ncbi:MAG: hypothetical protein SFW67_37245 [Myxococcaceae bacterium]|nr:hypothetical protein [Myxococcaceae bacterium]